MCCFFSYREQNSKLVPMLLKRLRKLQSSSDFPTPSAATRTFSQFTGFSPPYNKPESSGPAEPQARPFAHLNNASSPYKNDSPRSTSNQGTKRSKYIFEVLISK